MFASSPLEKTVEKIDRIKAKDALRLAIIAELDAISLYTQIASRVDDEKLKKVFLDVAREEKTHVGEFLGLLLELDPEQAKELEKGFEEIEELTGSRPTAIVKRNNASREEEGNEGGKSLVEQVLELFKKGLKEGRILSKYLPSIVVGLGVEHAPYTIVGRAGARRAYARLQEFSTVFEVDEQTILWGRARGGIDAPQAIIAGSSLALEEEKAIIDQLRRVEEVFESTLEDWSTPGAALSNLAEAVATIKSKIPSAALLLVVSPKRLADLVAYHEKTGVMELERVKRLIGGDVIAHPLLDYSEAYILPLTSSVIDVAFGVKEKIDYLGLNEKGMHVFRGWETLGLRVKYPEAIARLKA